MDTTVLKIAAAILVNGNFYNVSILNSTDSPIFTTAVAQLGLASTTFAESELPSTTAESEPPSTTIAESEFTSTTIGEPELTPTTGSMATNVTTVSPAPCPCFTATTTSSPVVSTTVFLKVTSVEPEPMPSTAMCLTLLPLVFITLFIVVGNVMVVMAVFTKRSLRTPQNIYIVSLALTDMGVALIVLPFNMTKLVLQKWPFGSSLCKLYLTLDVSLCCVSIFHLCAIGVDRYRAITEGISYVQKRNLKSVLTNIFFLWMIALWIGSPTWLSVAGWSVRADEHACEMPDSIGFNFHLAIGGLFFPLVLMSVIYAKIYYAIQERLRERARVTCVELTSDADTTDRLDSTVSKDDSGKIAARRKPSAQIVSFLATKQKFSLSKERKAAQTLGIIMAAFVLCWLPLGFLNVIGSLLPDDLKPHEIWFYTLTWLGYFNSGLNPVIYGISNQEYRKAFRRILKLE